MKPSWSARFMNLSRPERGLFVARLLVLLFMLLLGGVFITGVVEFSSYSAANLDKFKIFGWTSQQMDVVWGQIGLSFQWWVQWNLVGGIGFALVWCTIGIFLFIRKGQDWFGLYLAGAFVLFGTLAANFGGNVAVTHPSLDIILNPLGVFGWPALFLILYLFPSGHFVPGWTRWVVVLTILGFGVDVMFYQGGTPPPWLLLLIMFLIAIGPVSQVYRYRKVSNAAERQQTRLVMLAMVLVVIVLLIAIIPLFVPKIDPASPLALLMALLALTTNFVVGLIPLSIALAIFRYRLWDIDLIIRRTLVYGALTASLGLVYFGSVILLQQVLGGLAGESSVAIVISTLLIAALFSPLRRRVQGFIDRRFFRQKYDTTQALEEFSAAARREVELERLTGQLQEVVMKTVQPEGVWIWIRNDPK